MSFSKIFPTIKSISKKAQDISDELTITITTSSGHYGLSIVVGLCKSLWIGVELGCIWMREGQKRWYGPTVMREECGMSVTTTGYACRTDELTTAITG